MDSRRAKGFRLATMALVLIAVQNTHGLQPSQAPAKSNSHSQLDSLRSVLQPDGFSRSGRQKKSFLHDTQLNESEDQPLIVMLDPGHGGSDPGSVGHNGLMEKDLTLDIAKRVRLFLDEHDDIEVRLTRYNDDGLSRQERVDAIKRAEADVVISLHFNHLPQSEINLVESYYASRPQVEKSLAVQFAAQQGQKEITLHHTQQARNTDLAFTEGSQRLASTLQQHIYSEVSFEKSNVKNAGVKQKMLYVLTRSMLPGALIEISCLSHEAEAEKLTDENYRSRLAASLVDGIRNYHDTLKRAPLPSPGNIGV